MSCVHYKFSSKLNYDTVTFDGLNITLADLKRQIMGRERLKAVDCGLQITNAQTKEEYKDDEALISKNSSVIIRRIPIGGVKASSKMYNIERFSEQNHFPVQNLPVGSSKGDRSSEHSHFSIGSSKGIDDHASSISLAQLSKVYYIFSPLHPTSVLSSPLLSSSLLSFSSLLPFSPLLSFSSLLFSPLLSFSPSSLLFSPSLLSSSVLSFSPSLLSSSLLLSFPSLLLSSSLLLSF
uniref:DWNN domain-containing protein n=1 Tax=Oncorhynchus tshawytscha TaxID=74940 RepID=A0AAZ3NQ05_ONCTS